MTYEDAFRSVWAAARGPPVTRFQLQSTLKTSVDHTVTVPDHEGSESISDLPPALQGLNDTGQDGGVCYCRCRVAPEPHRLPEETKGPVEEGRCQ